MKDLLGKKEILDGLSRKDSIDYPRKNFGSFTSWVEEAKTVTCPDFARHLLYYGFQPLYDALMNEEVEKKLRPAALSALEEIKAGGIEYLSSYYLGKPEVKVVQKLAKNVDKTIQKIGNYYYKDRNIDRNGISPKDINKFLRTYIDQIGDGFAKPETIIGCACGSAEIVMALAGILGSQLEFIRRSKRRSDEEAKVIPEQKSQIAKICKDKTVVVVEDYVCSARSLYEVMTATQKFKPKKLIGASVNGWSTEISADVKMIKEKTKFQIYTLK